MTSGSQPIGRRLQDGTNNGVCSHSIVSLASLRRCVRLPVGVNNIFIYHINKRSCRHQHLGSLVECDRRLIFGLLYLFINMGAHKPEPDESRRHWASACHSYGLLYNLID